MSWQVIETIVSIGPALQFEQLCLPPARYEYKIKSRIDLESINDELAGFPAAVRVTEEAIIEIAFEKPIDEKIRQRIDCVMSRLGAEPTGG